MRVSENNPYKYESCPELFKYNLKEDFIKSNLNEFSFKVDFQRLDAKAIPVLKVFSSYDGQHLIKFTIFKDCLKVSSLCHDIFSDVKVPIQEPILDLNEKEFFEFVIDADKFLKYLAFINSGSLLFEVNLDERSLTIHYKNAVLNVRLYDIEEFLDYEKFIENRELLSNEFHCENIKNGLDFCNLIFSRHEETAKMKQIQLCNNLIYGTTPYIGSSAVFYENFGNVEYSISHNLIKIFSQILPIFEGKETKIYKTEKHTIFKDSGILFGIPSPLNTSIDIKDKIEKLTFTLGSMVKFSMNRRDLVQSLNFLSVSLRDKEEDFIKINFNKNLIKLSVEDHLTGKESFDEYPVRYEGKEITISLRYDSIMKNLRFFPNRELVDIEIVGVDETNFGIRIIEEHNGVKYSSFFINGLKS